MRAICVSDRRENLFAMNNFNTKVDCCKKIGMMARAEGNALKLIS